MASIGELVSSPGAYMSLAELSEELTFQRAILQSIEDEPLGIRDEAAVLAATETIRDLEAHMRRLKDKKKAQNTASPSRNRNMSSSRPAAIGSSRTYDPFDMTDPFADQASTDNSHTSTSNYHPSGPTGPTLSGPDRGIPILKRSFGEHLDVDAGESSNKSRRTSPSPFVISRSVTPSTSGDDDISKELERAQRAAEIRAKRERDDAEFARQLQAQLSGGSATSANSAFDSSGPSTSSSEDSIIFSAANSENPRGPSAFDKLLGRNRQPSNPIFSLSNSPPRPDPSSQQSTTMASPNRRPSGPSSQPRLAIPGGYPMELSDSDSDIEIISSSRFHDNGRHNHTTFGQPSQPQPQQPSHSNWRPYATYPMNQGNGPSNNTGVQAVMNPPPGAPGQPYRGRQSWDYPTFNDLIASGDALARSQRPSQPYQPSPYSTIGQGFGNFLGGHGRDYDDDDLSRVISRTSNYDYSQLTDGFGMPLDSRTALAVADYVNDPRKTRAEIQELLENIRPDMEIPKENREGTPDGLKYPLYEHQKIALSWLKSMEEGTNKGGILADDMGLGKTISALALLLSRPSSDNARKTTLIVGPVALVRQWQREIRVKINTSHRLTTFLYHAGKKASWDNLRNHDIVLTTYGTLGAEYKRLVEYEKKLQANRDYAKTYNTGLKLPFLGPKSKWYRVILDEAQCIKNKNTNAARAACHLQALSRFCLTGTPMMNGVHELYSLIHFLRIKPYNDYGRFQQDFGCLTKGNRNPHITDRAMQKLQAVLKAILLRRTKQSEIDGKPILTLPPKTEEVVHAIFSEEEDAYYRALEGKTRLQFNKYLRANTVGKNYSNILVLLLRLRQAACHPHLIMDFEEAPPEATVDEMLALAKTLTPDVVKRIIDATVPFECPVCYDPVPNPRIVVPCGHDTCSECMVKISENYTQGIANGDDVATAKCPTCRGVVDPKRLIDYETFKKVHMPGAASAVKEEDDEATQSEDDGESIVDSDSDSETESEVDDDDDADLPDIRDFVVPDDHVSSDEVEDEGDDSDDDDDNLEVKFEREMERSLSEPAEDGDKVKNEEDDEDDDDLELKFEPEVKRAKSESAEAKVKDEVKDEDEDEDIVPRLSRSGKRKAKSLDEDDDDYAPDTAESSKKAAPVKKTRSKSEKGKKDKKSKKPKKDRKGKGKRKVKGRDELPKHMSLSKLKKEASRSVEGHRRYMKYLRKNWITSAKVEKCLEILRDTDPNVKTIIFSQFTTFMDLLEVPLRQEEQNYVRYDGSMSGPARNNAVEKFTDDPRVKIMIVSLKAGNAGLNLVAASQVIILDPFWNPFIEMQAVDRAHRIGQQNPVSVHRILVQNTVEDRIIELQNRKRKLVDAALDEKASEGLGRLNQRELIYLFNGNEAEAPGAAPGVGASARARRSRSRSLGRERAADGED